MLSIKNKTLIFFILFVSLVISLKLGENSSGGSKHDFFVTKIYIDTFKVNFLLGLEMFKTNGEIHLPFFYILIANLNKFFGDTLVKYFYLIISSIIPLILYSSLKKKFSQANFDHLFLLSLLVFLSPYFRSSAIWLTTDNLALLFFLLSINSYLKFETSKSNFFSNAIFCFTFLILASYVRYYYSIFFVFFFLMMQSKLSFKDKFYIILYNIFCSIPFLLYLKFFLDNGNSSLPFNFVGFDFIFNALTFTSLFFFYFLPFLFNRYSLKKISCILNKKKKHIIIISLIILTLFLFYEIPNLSYGGGIFYKISNFFNLDIFYIFSFLGFLFFYLFNENILRNNIIFLILIFGFPVSTLFQKYYDPLIIIIYLTLTSSTFLSQIISKIKKKNLLYIFVYFLFFLISSNIYYISD